MPMTLIRTTILLQGLYFLITGIWPLIGMASFMAVTGPKTDIWLVRTFSMQICAMGVFFCISAIKRDLSFNVLLLSILSAIGFIVADVYYVIKGVIDPIYLADAVVELIIAFLVTSFILFRRKLEAGV
jgi:hypothetical protein